MHLPTRDTMNGLVDAVNEGFDECNWRMIQLRSILKDVKSEVMLTQQVIQTMLSDPNSRVIDIDITHQSVVANNKSSEIDTITIQWKNPFVMQDKEENDTGVGSRVIYMEVIVNVPVMASNEVSLDEPKRKKQKVMTDYFPMK